MFHNPAGVYDHGQMCAMADYVDAPHPPAECVDDMPTYLMGYDKVSTQIVEGI